MPYINYFDQNPEYYYVVQKKTGDIDMNDRHFKLKSAKDACLRGDRVLKVFIIDESADYTVEGD